MAIISNGSGGELPTDTGRQMFTAVAAWALSWGGVGASSPSLGSILSSLKGEVLRDKTDKIRQLRISLCPFIGAIKGWSFARRSFFPTIYFAPSTVLYFSYLIIIIIIL